MTNTRILPLVSAPPPQRPPAELYARAECADIPPGIFDGASLLDIGAAKAVCRDCPVQGLCLDWAMANEAFGIWGGMTPAERDRLRGYPLRVTLDDRAEAELLRRRIQSGVSLLDIASEYGVVRRSVERWKSRAAALQPSADMSRGADHV